MRRLLFGVTTLTCIVAASAILAAQAPAGAQGQGGGRGGAAQQPQQPHKNTQILDQNMPNAQLIGIMQQFSAALGVTCGHCHVWTAPGNPMNDFPSDAKPAKNVSRTMMRMVRDLNAKLGSELGKPAAEVTQVGCVTCHRGVPIPKQLVDIVADTTRTSGATAGVTQYRELRKQFYGAQAYDFREDTLLVAAQRATQDNRPDDALALLNANLEYFPMGARTYQAMSVAYQRKMDRPNAIKSLQRAVELAPENAQFKNQLTQLQMPPAGN